MFTQWSLFFTFWYTARYFHGPCLSLYPFISDVSCFPVSRLSWPYCHDRPSCGVVGLYVASPSRRVSHGCTLHSTYRIPPPAPLTHSPYVSRPSNKHSPSSPCRRIDANVEDTSMNVEAAHSEILKYFQSVSSNRWLMVKVFGVLITFFIVFVMFLT